MRPVQAMPIFFQRLAMLLPTYWLAEGMILAVEGAPAADLVFPLVMMLLFSVAFILLGSLRRIA